MAFRFFIKLCTETLEARAQSSELTPVELAGSERSSPSLRLPCRRRRHLVHVEQGSAGPGLVGAAGFPCGQPGSFLTAMCRADGWFTVGGVQYRVVILLFLLSKLQISDSLCFYTVTKLFLSIAPLSFSVIKK